MIHITITCNLCGRTEQSYAEEVGLDNLRKLFPMFEITEDGKVRCSDVDCSDFEYPSVGGYR